jgi:hypothetical protein
MAIRIVETKHFGEQFAATSLGRSVMRDTRLTRRQAPLSDKSLLSGATVSADIGKLLEENAQLRELVIQLTKIAIKNITDPARRVN